MIHDIQRDLNKAFRAAAGELYADTYYYATRKYKDGATHLRILAPGLKKGDFKIKAYADKIDLDVEPPKDDEEWDGLGVPRLSGKYTFRLHHRTDTGKVKAKLSAGILELTIPNEEEQNAADVPIT